MTEAQAFAAVCQLYLQFPKLRCLTYSRCRILDAIYGKPGITMKQIKADLHLSGNSAYDQIKVLLRGEEVDRGTDAQRDVRPNPVAMPVDP